MSIKNQTIDLTPSWAGVANIILLALEHGTPEGKAVAKQELRKMAAVADKYVEKKKFPEFYSPDSVPAQWDDIEVHGCAVVADDGSVETVDDDQAEFWSVYLHDVNGGVQCIADLETSEQASAFANLLEVIVKNHKS